jgi:hypothetical protein
LGVAEELTTHGDVYLFGAVSYLDIFGQQHHAYVCFGFGNKVGEDISGYTCPVVVVEDD